MHAALAERAASKKKPGAALPGLASRARPAERFRPPHAPVAHPREQALEEGLRSPGLPLDVRTRRAMERSFGRDLGDIRIHVGEPSAAKIGAAAYTVGKDVVFGAGRYTPEDVAGRQLLAHELVHALQQKPATTRPAADASAESESEARVAAARVVAGLPAPPIRATAPPALARQDEREPVIPPLSIPYGGGGRLTLFPGAGPLTLAGARLPLAGSLRLTNALGAGRGPTFVLDLDPRHLVFNLLGRVDLRTSALPGTPPGREDDPTNQARLQLVDPQVRLDFSSGRIDGRSTLHVPSAYPPALHPGTDVDLRVESSVLEPRVWRVAAAYGPLTANATLRLHYDVGRLGASLGSGPADLGRELAAPGLSASGTARLFGLPITRFELEAATTRERARPLLGAPTAFPSQLWAAGIILAPPGSVTSVTAPALGFTGASFGERSGISGTAVLLPTISPEAISAGAPLSSMLPVHAYAEVSYVRRVSDGLEVGVRAVAQVNTAELLNPPAGLPPEPGARREEPEPLRREPPALPTPVSPYAGVTVFGRFNAF